MLDRRALIIACLIVIAAAGAYVVWVKRPQAVTTARSLSAAGRPANSDSQTSALHVDGCKDDFIVTPGELVEPRVVPAANPDQVRRIYGPETKTKDGKQANPEEPGILRWKLYEYSVAEGYFGPVSGQNFVQVSANPGHVVKSLDGIELGLDSFGTIFRKMRDKRVEVHERIESEEGNSWTLIISLYSACGSKFRSEYTRTIPASPETDKSILPIKTIPNGQADSQTAPLNLLRSDIFMNKVVSTYSLVPSNNQNDSPHGVPSTHE